MNANPNQIEALLSNFSTVLIDGTHEAVNITTEKAGSFWDKETREEQNPPVQENDTIVRVETEEDSQGDCNDFYFHLNDLLTANIQGENTLELRDTEGTQRTLVFRQENPVRLLPPQNINVICANDSVMLAVLPNPYESDEAYQQRTKDILENLAKSQFEKNKGIYQDDPSLGRTAYENYRHTVYWHVHAVSAS